MPTTLHLRFISFDACLGRDRPLPAGTPVRALDANLLLADQLLAAGTVGEDGRCTLQLSAGEARPDVYLELDLDPATVTRLDLPRTWHSRQAFAEDRRPGLLRNLERDQVGSPDQPWTLRLTLDCHLRFVWWSDHHRTYRGVPAGLRVQAIDLNPLGGTRVMGHALTDDHGHVVIQLPWGPERRPDLAFIVSPPAGGPAHIDPTTGTLADQGIRLPGHWRSRDALALTALDRRGYWDDFGGSVVGRPDSPYVFDLLGHEPGLRAGTLATPLIDGVRLLGALVDAIDAAVHSVHVEVMLFFDDPMGHRIKDALLAAVARGVTVRVLIDVDTTSSIHQLFWLEALWARVFQTMSDDARAARLAELDQIMEEERRRADVADLVAELSRGGVTLIDTSFPKVQLLPGPLPGLPEAYDALERALPFFAVARIDHRKLVVVDGRVAILGGQNVGREYLYEQPFDPMLPAEAEPWSKWHDVSVRLEGPAVRDVQALFRERWVSEGGAAFDLGPSALGEGTDPHHPTFPALDPSDDGLPVRILATTPGARMEFHQVFLELVGRAGREILVESPYFASRETLDALCHAARRGVRVVFIFPDERNDSVDFRYAGRLTYDQLLDAGVEVYEYRHHMCHTKAAVIDDACIIGSANLNHSSFFNHYEIAALIDDAGFAADLRRRLFERDLPQSRPIAHRDLDGLLDINAAARLYLRTVVMSLF